MDKDKLAETLTLHANWSRGEPGGVRANLARANLARANLAGANLVGAYLADANLADAYLADANLADANLAGAYLAGAYLADANLVGAYLVGANLAGAYLAGANLVGANLVGANLADANLAGATLREGLKAGRYIGGCSRGDYYVFYAFETDAGEPFYFAGCRAFLRSEFEAHIEAGYPGTAKAAATRACLDYLANLKPL